VDACSTQGLARAGEADQVVGSPSSGQADEVGGARVEGRAIEVYLLKIEYGDYIVKDKDGKEVRLTTR